MHAPPPEWHACTLLTACLHSRAGLGRPATVGGGRGKHGKSPATAGADHRAARPLTGAGLACPLGHSPAHTMHTRYRKDISMNTTAQTSQNAAGRTPRLHGLARAGAAVAASGTPAGAPLLAPAPSSPPPPA